MNVPKTVPSTSDERTINNLMRHSYRALTEAEKLQMQQVKDQGSAFVALLHEIGASDPQAGRQAGRELSIAQTKIEEAVMWAVKHITR